MKNIKVIMCDIDGTLLNSKGIVTSKTIDAIKKVREQGILFGISTGRDVPSVKRLFGKWGIGGLVVWKDFQKSKCIETDSGMYFCVFSDRSVWDRTSQAVSVLDPGSLCGMFSGSSSVHVPFLLCEDHSGRKIRRILRNL